MSSREFDAYCQAEFNSDPKRQDKQLALSLHRVEKEFGVLIDEHYPYFKFLSQMDYLSWESQQMKKHQQKNKSKRRR